jgi:hypothetical protein
MSRITTLCRNSGPTAASEAVYYWSAVETG